MDVLGPVPPPIAALLIEDLLCGLSYAHAHGLVHRDLKPANLLLTLSGRLRVIDFGIASSGGTSTQTRTGEIIGTPSYMRPEQALGLPVGPASDVFSVGTILYDMITGVNPFAHPSQALTLSSVSGASVVPIFEVDPTVPPGIERLLDTLLDADPALRCASADVALAIVREARAHMADVPESVIRRMVEEPRATAELVLTEQALADRTAAQALRASGNPASIGGARAALLAYRARAVGSDRDAVDLQAGLCEQHRFSFHDVPPGALRALEAKVRATPLGAEYLRHAAEVAWGDGELLCAAAFWKRYLRLRPGRAQVRRRLVAIFGDDVGVAAAGGGVMYPSGTVGDDPKFESIAPATHLVLVAGPAVVPVVALAPPSTTGVLVGLGATGGGRGDRGEANCARQRSPTPGAHARPPVVVVATPAGPRRHSRRPRRPRSPRGYGAWRGIVATRCMTARCRPCAHLIALGPLHRPSISSQLFRLDFRKGESVGPPAAQDGRDSAGDQRQVQQQATRADVLHVELHLLRERDLSAS